MPGVIRTRSIPARTRNGQIASAKTGARISHPRLVRGATRFAASPTAKWPMNKCAVYALGGYPGAPMALLRAATVVAILFAATRAGAVPQEEIDEVRRTFPDARGALRFGWGHSELFDASIFSLSFEDEITLRRLGDHAEVDLVVGLDSQSAPERTGPAARSFVAGDVGLAILLRPKLRGPILVLGATMGALFAGGSEDWVDGFGGAARAELFPMYRDLVDAVLCEEGAMRDWILSGFSVWVTARQDQLEGDSGASWAAGLGLELGRQAILPILAGLLDTSCYDPSFAR